MFSDILQYYENKFSESIEKKTQTIKTWKKLNIFCVVLLTLYNTVNWKRILGVNEGVNEYFVISIPVILQKNLETIGLNLKGKLKCC